MRLVWRKAAKLPTIMVARLKRVTKRIEGTGKRLKVYCKTRSKAPKAATLTPVAIKPVMG